MLNFTTIFCMQNLKLNHLFFVLLFLNCNKTSTQTANAQAQLSIRGAEISFLPQIRQSGLVVKNFDGNSEDMLTTLIDAGANTFRIKIWVNPMDGHAGFDEVKSLAKEVHTKGLKVWLTVHYSDTWADPGAQTKPVTWTGISFNALKDSVYQYTQKIVNEISPDYIQIGNEINSGLLWPDGNISNLLQMKALIAEGIKAVRNNSTTTKIMLHYAGYVGADFFFNNMADLDYDIIGLSYYPNWHGKNLDSLQNALIHISSTFKKDILIAETSYPFTLKSNDFTNNVIGTSEQILPQYPPTPRGQYDFFSKIKSIVSNTPEGIGFCYWGNEWVSFKGPAATNGSSWENQALWGFDNKVLEAIRVYGE